MRFSTIDIFCQVVDNFGDIGVVYRFAREFHIKMPDITIRVFVDDMTTFATINPQIKSDLAIQTVDSITYINSQTLCDNFVNQYGIAEVLVEAFACEIPQYIMEEAYFKSLLLINLEYLSAEPWVEEYHLKESLLPKGTLKKFFFMPGFTQQTGGVIIDSHVNAHTIDLLSGYNIIKERFSISGINPGPAGTRIIGTVFSYLRNFSALIQDIVNLNKPVYLLLFGSKSKEGILYSLNGLQYTQMEPDYIVYKNLHLIFMPYLSQQHYDSLLYFTDFNIVRGEDSLVRAILAGKPFIWNAYLQNEKYQKVKVDALCRVMENFFTDKTDYAHYYKLLMDFNDIESEDPKIVSREKYEYFFNNLHNFEHSTGKMCYFIRDNCNLIRNFITFINEYKQ
jgi:uncharacterized repeat protein (TIGR03837 family)